MKPIKSLLALLTMPLIMSCSSEVLTQQKPIEAVPDTVCEVPTHPVRFRATVHDGSGNSTTRATLTTENHYAFSAGDVLYVQGIGEDKEKIYGVLELSTDDVGKTSDIVFDGNLNIADGFTPTNETPLKAVLVGANAKLYKYYGGFMKILSTTYPQDNALAASLAEAVEKYSDMTAEGTYGGKEFNLTQNSCFVNFTVTLADGTEEGEDLTVVVETDEDLTDYRNGQVTTVKEDDVVKAKFVLAFPGETPLNGALIRIDPRTPITFGGTTTLAANKIYNVNKTFNKIPGSIEFLHSSFVKSFPDFAFGNMMTLVGDGTVSYESDKLSVATVNNYGEVTIVGPGTATITATVTDGVNYTYEGNNTASYTVEVKAPVAMANVTSAQVGWVMGSDDKAYVTLTGAQAAESTPVAMIGYVGDAGSAEANSTYRGLAVALEDAKNGTVTRFDWSDDEEVKSCTDALADMFPMAKTAINGIANTARLHSHACRVVEDWITNPEDQEDQHVHDAADAAYNYSVTGFTPADHGCSGWFLPSAGQWFKVLDACGVTTSQWQYFGYCPDSAGGTTNRADNYTRMQTLMEAVGDSFESQYWTSTESTEIRVCDMEFDSTTGVAINIKLKSFAYRVRPFIAF